MIRSMCMALCALLIAAPVRADECAQCPVAKQVTELLGRWKTAAAADKAQSVGDRKALAAKCAELCKQCPIGSRIAPTLATAKIVLTCLVAADKANEKGCPLAAATAQGGEAAKSCDDAVKLKAARTKLIADLLQLTTYAAGDGEEDSGCGGEDPICQEKCNAAHAVALNKKIAELGASWKKASAELKSLTPEQSKAIGEGFASLCQSSQSMALVMPTIAALADGFDALGALHTGMNTWTAAHPAVMNAMSADMRECWTAQSSVVTEMAGVMGQIRAQLKGCEDCEQSQKPASDAR